MEDLFYTSTLLGTGNVAIIKTEKDLSLVEFTKQGTETDSKTVSKLNI